jgi:hypothetical protein
MKGDCKVTREEKRKGYKGTKVIKERKKGGEGRRYGRNSCPLNFRGPFVLVL